MIKKSNSFRRRTALGLGAFALAGATLLGSAVSANADPVGAPIPRALSGTGSDTIQDVFNGLGNTITYQGSLAIGSYDATGGGDITTSVTFPRPNGSSDGVRALSSAISSADGSGQGAVWAGALQDALPYDALQFARSSSGTTHVPGAPLVYLPFATDAVTYATSSNSVIPSGIPLGDGNPDSGTSTTPAALNLENIYRGDDNYVRGTIGGTQYSFYIGTGTPAAGYTKLDVYLPQAGSGTRTFWSSKLGFSGLPAGVSDTFSGGDVQEHDGSALAGNPNAIVPFSIAQWVAQRNSGAANQNGATGHINGVPVVDRRHNALLNAVGSVNPLTGGTSAGTLNGSFPVKRTTYVVVEYAAIKAGATASGTATQKALNSVFGVGGTAYNASVIQAFGFATTTDAGKGPDDAQALRANLRFS